MKDLFPQYQDKSEEEYSIAWQKATFVFDANVLLNLYRYHSETRDELLKVIKKISKRIWIPNYAALEFYRNRINVISDQEKKFNDVKSAIQKTKNTLNTELDKLQLQKRHSLIDPTPLKQGLEGLEHSFSEQLNKLQGSQQTVSSEDPIKTSVENLFSKAVGLPPKNQKELDELYKLARFRYDRKIPPGYEDSKKSSSEPEFLHERLIYNRCYGDFVIWRQMLEHCKNNEIEHLVFVTDDNKEDWWQKVGTSSKKTLGPRPELIGEALVEGELESFTMYNPEMFLKHSRNYIKAKVSDNTLDEVQQLSKKFDQQLDNETKYQASLYAIYRWINKNSGDAGISASEGFGDIMSMKDGKLTIYEVDEANDITLELLKKITKYINSSHTQYISRGAEKSAIIIIAPDIESGTRIGKVLKANFQNKIGPSSSIIVGLIDKNSEDNEFNFFPISEFSSFSNDSYD